VRRRPLPGGTDVSLLVCDCGARFHLVDAAVSIEVRCYLADSASPPGRAPASFDPAAPPARTDVEERP